MASRASKWSADRAHVCRAIEKCGTQAGALASLAAHCQLAAPGADPRPDDRGHHQLRRAKQWPFFCSAQAADKEVAHVMALAQRENDVKLPDGLPGHPLPGAPRGPDDSPVAIFPFHGKPVGYADLVDIRIARGVFFKGPCAIWFRLRHPLLESEEPSAYQRVAVAADSGNGGQADETCTAIRQRSRASGVLHMHACRLGVFR
jgi:hypothetical protein